MPKAMHKRKRQRHFKNERHARGKHNEAGADYIDFVNQSRQNIHSLVPKAILEEDRPLRRAVQNFPHRGLVLAKIDHEKEAEVSEDKPSSSKLREDKCRGPLDVLLRSIEQFLDRGKIDKAVKAYGIVLQLRPRSQPMDVRMHKLWALGAEILMRQGEEMKQGEAVISLAANKDQAMDREDGQIERMVLERWGSPTNMNKVKAFFETLIRRHPYDHRFPHKTSAINFWLSMLNCEIYNVYAEYVTSLDYPGRYGGAQNSNWVQEGEANDTPAKIYPMSQSDRHVHPNNITRKESTIRYHEEIRRWALDETRGIIKTIESLMEQPPYSKLNDLSQLHAGASSFAYELSTSISSSHQNREVEIRKVLGLQLARGTIGELIHRGNESGIKSDDEVPDFYATENEDMLQSPSHLYQPLPIRKI